MSPAIITAQTKASAGSPFCLVLRGILGKWKLTDRVLVNWLSKHTTTITLLSPCIILILPPS
ncbi:hypothetical protein VCX22_19695, partial [Aeromonas caviae]|uniref:hypothetical protein n=2 Tax=Aeromonas TaxID=642 RepID=UPI002B2407A1